MGSKTSKGEVEKCRLSNANRFREFNDLVKINGTFRMREELNWFHEIAIQTAAKGMNPLHLKDGQELFQTKLAELRWVNGYNDVTNADFERISDEWHQVVLELHDDFDADDMYDFDERTEVLEINVASFNSDFINLERIIYKKA